MRVRLTLQDNYKGDRQRAGGWLGENFHPCFPKITGLRRARPCVLQGATGGLLAGGSPSPGTSPAIKHERRRQGKREEGDG